MPQGTVEFIFETITGATGSRTQGTSSLDYEPLDNPVEGKAVMGLALDDPLPPAALEEIQAIEAIDGVRAVELSLAK